MNLLRKLEAVEPVFLVITDARVCQASVMLDDVLLCLLSLRAGSELGMSTTEPTPAQRSVFGGNDILSDVAPRPDDSRVEEFDRESQPYPEHSRYPKQHHSASMLPDVASGHPELASNRRLIKRYSNRKLYDTHASRYVTLTQIAEMVGVGELVRVVDNKTREDKTEFTFAQVILEQLKSSTPGVAQVKLAEIIRECQRSRPGTGPVVDSEAAPSVTGHKAEGEGSWQAYMEDQLERLPAAEAAAWRARLRDLNARLGELQQRTHRAGMGPFGS